MASYTRSTYRQNQKVALECRALWGIGDKTRPDLIRVIETEFPKLYPGFKLIVAPRAELNGSEGSADRTNNTITLAHDVYNGAKALKSSSLYAVAEEMGHFAHKHKGTRHRRSGALRNAGDFDTGVYEREARQFASLLLAPTHLIRECNTVDEILDVAPLTRPAAAIRLDELKSEERSEQAKNHEVRPITSEERIVALKTPSDAKVTKLYDEIIEAQAPSPNALAIVEIQQSSLSRCIVSGHVPRGRVKNVEVVGPEKHRLLPFTGPQLLIKRLRGNAFVKVVGWQEEPGSDFQTPETAFCRLNGYDGSKCPECGNRTVRVDGNCKTCRCGWTSSTS